MYNTHTPPTFYCSAPAAPAFSTAKDRLLTSEIRELQAKVQALEKENHELKQELAKTVGVDPSKIRTRRKVHPWLCLLTRVTPDMHVQSTCIARNFGME